MRVVLDFPGVRDDAFLAELARDLLRTVARYNLAWMREEDPPGLYASGVRFRPEPWAGEVEQFASGPVVLASGWGDCAQLCAYRVAELWRRGVPADFHIYGRMRGKGRRRRRAYHVQVRHPPSRLFPGGWIEDPSRLLEF